MTPRPRIETTAFRRAGGGLLSKRISLRPDGSVKSDASPCRMTNGEAWRVGHDGLGAFAEYLDGLSSNEALALGALTDGLPDHVSIVTKAARDKLNGHVAANVIARTDASIVFRPDAPALMLLDHDIGGMPDTVRAEIERLGGFWQTVVSVMPALAGAGHVVRPSTSSGLSRADTSAVFPGSGGLHTYVVVQVGADIPRFLRRLYDACWLAGFGWFKAAKDGKPLERSIIDPLVGDPSRMIFEGAPQIILPLVQAVRRAEFFDGGIVDTSALPPLSDAQQTRLDDLREAARQRFAGPPAARVDKLRAEHPPPSPRAADGDGLEPVRTALRADAAGVAEALLGPHNKKISRRGTRRWGKKGSLALEVAGAKRGKWFDHEAGVGGDLLGLIRHVKGGSFADAVAWARNRTGIAEPIHTEPVRITRTKTAPASRRSAPDAPPEPAPEPGAQPAGPDDDAADAEADRAGKIAFAQRLAAESIPVAGTVGEDYLKLVRGIPCPAGGWPASIRWHPGCNALLVIATTADGTVQAVQLVHLDPNGEKIAAEEQARRGLPAVKMTYGVTKGAAVRFPGDPTGPLLLAEGPETALAAHTATGHETWCALGPVGRLEPPIGRRALVIADDNPRVQDAKNGGAAKTLRDAVRDWRRQGVDVAVAYPWQARRYDKSDFADLILADGVEAVCARVLASLEPVAAARAGEAVEAVRPALREAVAAFFAMEPGDPDQPPVVHAVRVDVGVGKSHEARRFVVETLTAMRAAGDKRTIVIAVPRHGLADDQAARLKKAAGAADLKVAVWRGRDAADPDHPDFADDTISKERKTKMCTETDRVADAQAVMDDVETSCCLKRKVKLPDGAIGDVPCVSYDTCAHQNQKHRRADIWLVPHQLLFGEKPAAIGEVGFVIVDESIWRAGLDGVDGPPRRMSLDALAENTRVYPDSVGDHHLATARLSFLRTVLLDALRAMPDGPLCRNALAATMLTPDSCAEAVALEWSTKIDANMHPGMSRRERKERCDACAANGLIPRRVALWQAIKALLTPDGPEASGWAALATEVGDDGPRRMLVLKGRKTVRDGWQVPTLLLDANLPMELNRHFWPNIELVADIRARAPHQRVRQVVDRAYGKSMFIPKLMKDGTPADPEEANRGRRKVRELRAILIREARPYVERGVLVVVQQAVELALRKLGPLPAHITLAHHNDVTGLDRWNEVGLLIVVGRTQPPSAAVECLAEAITGRAIEPLAGRYGRRDAVREITSGRHVLAEADFHPDPDAEAIRWQVCEGELVQIVGRGRGVNRTASNPLDVLIMTDVVLPIPVDEEVYADDLKPSPVELMLAEGGIGMENPAHAAAVYPSLWSTEDAAEGVIRRNRWGSKPPSKRHSPISDLYIWE